jgi:replication factor C small subunit
MSTELEYVLWAEKYRPKSLDEVVNQAETVQRLKKFIQDGNVPHMLFAGPPGTGKTTVALAFAHDLYGPDYQRYILELNASDERGIDIIRTKVKEFARTMIVGKVPFKLIILDEADNLTADAQQALRRMMELFTPTSRFILIANYPSKIIEPIQSRTAVFRFTPLKKEDVISRLKYIAKNEGVEYDEKALEAIFDISEGDMRKAINILQAAAAGGKVTVEQVYKVVGLAHPREIREMIKLALNGDFLKARDKLRKLMIDYGLSGLDVIKQVHSEIFKSDMDLSEEAKVLIADYAGEIQFRLVEGGDDEIQLNAFLAWLTLLGKKMSIQAQATR